MHAHLLFILSNGTCIDTELYFSSGEIPLVFQFQNQFWDALFCALAPNAQQVQAYFGHAGLSTDSFEKKNNKTTQKHILVN